jgi:hypothetical protein
MKILAMLLGLVLVSGCASKNAGVSKLDAFDDVQVAQMVGNKVRPYVLTQRTVVCLNGRRETCKVPMITNTVVVWVTNATANAVTNQVISMSTNALGTTMTNLAPLQLTQLPSPAEAAGASPAATHEPAPILINSPPSVTTNFALSLSRNQSLTTSPSQTAANIQVVRTLNNQITTTSNNLSVSVMTNVVVTLETNQVVNYLTNTLIAQVTNVTITPTNHLLHDYFLYTEVMAPPEFTLASGESLVLLVDGIRWGFSPGPLGTVFVARKGYATTHYKVPPEVMVAIANSKEARMRIKGVNSVIDRTLSGASKSHFREFVLRYFTPEDMEAIKPDRHMPPPKAKPSKQAGGRLAVVKPE